MGKPSKFELPTGPCYCCGTDNATELYVCDRCFHRGTEASGTDEIERLRDFAQQVERIVKMPDAERIPHLTSILAERAGKVLRGEV